MFPDALTDDEVEAFHTFVDGLDSASRERLLTALEAREAPARRRVEAAGAAVKEAHEALERARLAAEAADAALASTVADATSIKRRARMELRAQPPSPPPPSPPPPPLVNTSLTAKKPAGTPTSSAINYSRFDAIVDSDDEDAAHKQAARGATAQPPPPPATTSEAAEAAEVAIDGTVITEVGAETPPPEACGSVAHELRWRFAHRHPELRPLLLPPAGDAPSTLSQVKSSPAPSALTQAYL
jgi:hypothetical protein